MRTCEYSKGDAVTVLCSGSLSVYLHEYKNITAMQLFYPEKILMEGCGGSLPGKVLFPACWFISVLDLFPLTFICDGFSL